MCLFLWKASLWSNNGKGAPKRHFLRLDDSNGAEILAYELEKWKCREIEPWFPPNHHYGQTHLIFFGKPAMQAIKQICIKRDWKMSIIPNDNRTGLRALERLSSQPQTFTIIYTSSKFFRNSIIQRLANSTSSLVAAVRYTFKITGDKKGQLKGFRAFFEKHGCDLRSTNIMPLSFVLDDPEECRQYFEHLQTDHESWWILKPSHGSRGVGISIHTNTSFLHKKFDQCNNKEQYIVQRYLSPLLLIQGRKFDIRGLVVIGGTNPYMLFYHEGYLRVSVERFNAKGGRAVHLTNSHIQIHSKSYSVDRHFWSFQRFQTYLDNNYPENDNFVSKRLMPFIKKVGLFTLQAGMFTIIGRPLNHY